MCVPRESVRSYLGAWGCVCVCRSTCQFCPIVSVPSSLYAVLALSKCFFAVMGPLWEIRCARVRVRLCVQLKHYRSPSSRTHGPGVYVFYPSYRCPLSLATSTKNWPTQTFPLIPNFSLRYSYTLPYRFSIKWLVSGLNPIHEIPLRPKLFLFDCIRLSKSYPVPTSIDLFFVAFASCLRRFLPLSSCLITEFDHWTLFVPIVLIYVETRVYGDASSYRNIHLFA